MRYYNGYFDEAGEENEEKVAAELDSPEKVAAAIKADLYGGAGDLGEYRETGYTDTRFERRETPAERGGYMNSGNSEKQRRWAKILLIIAIVLIGLPIVVSVVGPLAFGILAVVLAIVFSGFLLLACGVLTAVCVMAAGLVTSVAGLFQIPGSISVALVMTGGGMIMFVIGMIGTVLLVKACMILFPAMFRGIVNVCRKPFHRGERKAVQ